MDIVYQPYIIPMLALASAAMLWFAWPSKHRGRRRPGRGNDNRSALEKLSRNRAYWGVTIRGERCSAVRLIAGRKYSFEQAPALPLAGCRSRRCRCRYQGLVECRHRTRRTGTDRRQTDRLDASHPDRRSGRERRRSARAWASLAGRAARLSVRLES